MNGSEVVSASFDQQSLRNNIESEWVVGSGTISSTVDEIRISDKVRSND